MSGNVVESCLVISRPVRGEFLIMRPLRFKEKQFLIADEPHGPVPSFFLPIQTQVSGIIGFRGK